MYTRLLVPLDGSKTAEKVLPYSRFLAARLKLRVELLEVIDIVEIARLLTPEKARYLNTVVENRIRSSEQYLKAVAATFPGGNVKCSSGTPARPLELPMNAFVNRFTMPPMPSGLARGSVVQSQ